MLFAGFPQTGQAGLGKMLQLGGARRYVAEHDGNDSHHRHRSGPAQHRLGRHRLRRAAAVARGQRRHPPRAIRRSRAASAAHPHRPAGGHPLLRPAGSGGGGNLRQPRWTRHAQAGSGARRGHAGTGRHGTAGGGIRPQSREEDRRRNGTRAEGPDGRHGAHAAAQGAICHAHHRGAAMRLAAGA